MALPSQSSPTARLARFSGGRSRRRRHQRSRKPARRGRTLLILACAVSAIFIWIIWPSGGQTTTPPPAGTFAAGSDGGLTPDRTRPKPTTNRASTPKPTQPTGTTKPAPTTTIAAMPEPKPVTIKPEMPRLELRNAHRNPPREAQARYTPPSVAPAPSPRTNPALDMSTGAVARLVLMAEAAQEASRLIEARLAFNRALHHPLAAPADRSILRQRLSDLNDTMLFSRAIIPGDPLVDTYTIHPGDSLSTIAHDHDLNVDWRLLQRVNALASPRRVRVGQTLKLVRGPFHVVIDKSDYRLDLYARVVDPDGNRLFIRSFKVGLGEYSSTPLGHFIVRPDSKLINPEWTNPRTGKRFAPDDPENPIGERWIGLDGNDDATAGMAGYGIHGTIDPNSIGRDASMGCVRMAADDVAILYEMLASGVSEVEIVP